MGEIYIYPSDCEDCSTLGICGRVPATRCEWNASAGSLPEITLDVPVEPMGRHLLIVEDRIVKAVAPVCTMPEISGGSYISSVQIWTVSDTASKAERYVYSKQERGRKKKLLAGGTQVTVVQAPAEGRWKVIAGKVSGWMETDALEDGVTVEIPADRDGIEKAAPSFESREQLFRIYNVKRTDRQVTATARAIAADAMKNVTTYDTDDEVQLSAALNAVVSNTRDACDLKVYTDITGTRPGAHYRDQNPIAALINPETGLGPRWEAELAIDDEELYFLHRAGRDRGVRLEYGRNLTGIDIDVNVENVVTHILPVGEDKDGNPLYLPEGSRAATEDALAEEDRMVVCPNAGNYTFKRIYVLNVPEAKVEKKKVDVSLALARMRKAANELANSGVDLADVNCRITYARLGAAQRYALMRQTGGIYLYDTLLLSHPALTGDYTAEAVSIKWDCLRERVEEVQLGSLAEQTPSIPGWQISGTINGSKLLPGSVGSTALKNDIINARHIQAETIAAEHIQAHSILADRLDATTVNAMVLTAVTARIAELVADQITTDALYANIAEIGKAQINTANIVSANIDWASINSLAANIASVCFASIGDANITSAHIENLRAGMAKIMSARISALDAETADVNKLYADTARMLTAIISDANITTAQIGQLSAEIANMVSVSAKLASYDFESVKALLANTLQVDRVDGDLMTIRNLLVNSASMVNAVIGDLVVKATNGHYYRIDIGNDGTLNSMDVTSNLTPSEIAAAETSDGRKIVETDLTVNDLEVDNLSAASALVSEIVTKSLQAGAITAGEALIGSATIPTLYATVIKAIGDTLDLSANNSVRIRAGTGAAGDVQTIINASKDGIVLDAKTATLNDIELGGTNLVRLKEGTVSITTGSVLNTTDDYWYTRSRKYLRMTAYSGAYNVLRFDSQIPIVSGRQYVVSFNAWCYQIPDAEREAIILRVNLTAAGDPDGVIYDRIRNLKNGAPTRYSVPFTATQSGNLALRLYTIEPWTAGQLDITDVKLEEGTIPSKWSPNPLDIEERMSAAELKITDSAIVATVTQSAAYTGDISRVEQKADGVTTTVQNLRVGATNLARLGTDLVTVTTGSVINTTDDYWHTRSRKYLRMAAFSGSYNVVRFNSPIPIHPATYTLSFNAWTYGVPAAEREAIVLRCNLYGGTEGHDITFKTLTGLREGAPTRYTATFVAPDDLNELMVLRFLTFTPWTQGQLDITDVMFEQGTLASEWSPSPMDVDERLSAAELKITDSAIVSTVRSSSQYAADLAGKASATEMSQVQQKITDSAIVNTVRQSTAYQNDLGAKADASDVQANYALKSALTQTATDIRAEVNAVYSGSANLLRLAEGLVTITTGSVANAPNTDNYWYLRSRKYLHMAAFTGTYNVLRFNSSIPIVSGRQYTLSFNAWTYQISDSEREAIILRVNLTETGDPDGVTYGRITGLKNQSPTRYTLTFTATASGIMALRLITNEPWSAGRLEITDVKLEEGNKATGWSPHPEEFRSGSSIEITNDRIQMTSGEIDFYGSELAAAQEDAIVQITDDGMSATSVTAPDVMPVYTGDATLTASKPGDLAAIFQRLSHKVITRNITINVSVNQSGNATLYGALGGAQITVNGGNHTLSGQLSLIRCTVYPTFTGLKVVARGASALRQYGAFYAQYNSCSFETVSTASPAYVADLMHGARAFFNGCELLSYSGLALLSLNYGTDGIMYNCTGGTTGAFLRTAGCSFKGSGTRPIGTHTGANTSLLAPSSPASLTTAAGSYNGSTPSPSTDVVTTASFTPTHRRSYGGGSWTEDSSNLLRHGIMNGKSHVGCMWFDLSSLVGKTLTGATLTLSRNAAGPARADVWLKTINLAYGSGMINPNSAPVLWVANPEAAIGEVVRKQESSFDLDKDALAGLITNPGTNVAALMLYCTDDEAMGSHSYSSNYASYDAVTLTVSYQG